MPELAQLRSEAEAAIGAAGSAAELEELRVRYLGRKSELTATLHAAIADATRWSSPGSSCARTCRTVADADAPGSTSTRGGGTGTAGRG